MEFLLRPLNITRQVTIMAAVVGTAAGAVAYGISTLAADSASRTLVFAVAILAASAVGALICGLIVRERLRDLWQLVIAARGMGQGDLSTPITTQGAILEVYSLAKVLEQNRVRISTMLRELEAAKEWSDSQRSVQAYFLANISHEFRTPLAGMKVSLELLLEHARELSPSELAELLDSLHLSVASMTQLIDNLLESSKIEADQLTLRRASTPVEALIADAARLVQPFLNRRQQRLTVDLPLRPTPLTVDAARMVQVLVNLLANASKFSPANCTIDLVVDRAETHVRISVMDRGAGIPPDKRDGLFKRFVRLGATASEDYGSGLGLSVVKAIVEAHGGNTGVGARDGGGSRFWFSVPAMSVEALPPHLRMEPQSS